MKNLQRLPNQLLATLTLLISTLLFASNSMAIGPVVTDLVNVIESAKITVKTESNKTQGSITVTDEVCDSCEPESYPFNEETIFINPLGAERPINELATWKNARAMLIIRLSDNFVEKVQILTNDE